jgi:hypothetical protein
VCAVLDEVVLLHCELVVDDKHLINFVDVYIIIIVAIHVDIIVLGCLFTVQKLELHPTA